MTCTFSEILVSFKGFNSGQTKASPVEIVAERELSKYSLELAKEFVII